MLKDLGDEVEGQMPLPGSLPLTPFLASPVSKLHDPQQGCGCHLSQPWDNMSAVNLNPILMDINPRRTDQDCQHVAFHQCFFPHAIPSELRLKPEDS
jgi:hypothetical protein